MWVYDQSSGKLYQQIGENLDSMVYIATGYSGKGWAKNNPKAENVKQMGPIPRGTWDIIRNYDSARVGPFAIHLEPAKGTQTHGRSAFRIHGDSVKNPGTASMGCIILPRAIREQIMKSGDRKLRVIE